MKDRKRFDRITPGPMDIVPSAPPSLDAAGREAWDTGAAYLVDRGLLHTGDLHSLEAWALGISKIRRLEAELRDQPFLVEGSGGVQKANPLTTLLSKEHGLVKGWALALMLVPYARMGLSKATKEAVTPTAKGTEWDNLITMPKRGAK